MPTKPVRRSPADRRQAASKSAHWFHSKTPAAQKAYIAAHPNSIYAKQAAQKSANMAKRNPARLSEEARKAIKEKWDAQDRQRAVEFHKVSNKRYEPKVHAKAMKQREKHRSLYQKKADSLVPKIAEAKAKMEKHKASGSRHLQSAKTNHARLVNRHKTLRDMVKSSEAHGKAAQKAFDKFHGKKVKKTAPTKRPSVEP